MDSQWFNQAAKKMNGSDHNNAGNKIDLTLKLGLPNGDHENQHLDSDQMAPYHANLDIDVLYSYEGIINDYKMVKEGMNMENVGEGLMPNEVAWPQSSFLMETQSQYSHAQAQYMSSNNSYDISPPPLPCKYPHNSNFNINPNHNLQFAAAAATETARVMNDYTILDIPPRRADREMGMGIRKGRSSALRRAAAGKRRSRGLTFVDPYKICTNVNCNTNTTPMWRRGPLGPKSLCNACGIKYRKEEERRMNSEKVDMSSSETA